MRLSFDCRYALALLLALAFAIRVIPLTYSHFWDEAVFLQDARVILEGHSTYDEFFERPPLLSIVYAGGLALWNNLYVANVMQGLVTVLAVLFGFLYVRRSFGATAGFCAAFLLAFAPYFVKTSHELMTDMPAVALMLAAMWLFDMTGARAAFSAGVAYGLAVETRFTSIFLALYFLLEAGFAPERFRRLVWLGLGAAATLAPYLVWLKVTYGAFLYPFLMARRIVEEWTAPMPAQFYFQTVRGIFPPSLWALFAATVVLLILTWARRGQSGDAAESVDGDPLKRQTSLLVWGLAFFLYMLSIPHKEMRYLLPLAIPVVAIGAAGFAALVTWFGRRARGLQVAGALLAVFFLVEDYGASFMKVAGPLEDRTELPEVRIARYLREHSTASDTLYAAHDFPVLAFYSQRRTVSLLPIQAEFERRWRELMTQPGYFVYFLPDRIVEIHAVDPALQPDREFLATHPEFVPVESFPTAIVYRYTPS